MTDKQSATGNFTFISRSAPYGSNRAQLCLDSAFAAAVFEQQVSYLFMDDGVYQLVANQDAEAISSKTLGRMLETLDLYGIEDVMVLDSSLAERQLKEDDLLMPVTVIDAAAAKDLLARSQTVINL